MRRIHLILAMVALQLCGMSVLAADKPKSKGQKAVEAPAVTPVVAAQPTPPVLPLTLEPGRPVKLDGFTVVLNKVVPAGTTDALGGNAFTEYNLTITDNSPDKELLISNAAVSVRGELRYVVKDPDEIVLQEGMSTKTTVATAGATAAGFIGGMLGPLGAITSMIGVNAASSKVFVDDPQTWREEIKKRGFQGTEGASVFPSESVTGSVWFKQAAAEAAERIQLYVKQGGASRVVRFDLTGMPAPAAVTTTAKAE